jgi:hypothetical protein
VRELDQLRGDIEDALTRSERLEGELSSPQISAFVKKLREALELLRYAEDAASLNTHFSPTTPLSERGTHDWWYRCLERAGIVAPGVTRGQGMHKARQTAGRRVLEKTGNVKAVQTLLGLGSMKSVEDSYPADGVDPLDATVRDLQRQLLG